MSLLSAILPPFLAALGYAAAKEWGSGGGTSGLYWQSPAMFSFFAGLLVALGLRPVLTRVPWTRGTAFALTWLCLLAIGPASAWSEAALLERLGWLAFPYALRREPFPDLLAAWVAAGILAWLYRPRGGDIGWASLSKRLSRSVPAQWLSRLAFAGLAVSLVSLIQGLADGLLARSGWMQPLDPVNPWLRLVMAIAEGGAGSPDWPAAPGVLAVDWLRGTVSALPMLAIALVIRGSRPQMALVFGLIWFIVAEFAPLIEDQPFPSQTWLTLRAALDAAGAAAIGLAAAHILAPLTPDAGPPAPARVLDAA